MRAPVGRTDEPSRPTCAGSGRTPGARLHLRLPACARTAWRATFGARQILLLLTAWAVAEGPFIVYPHSALHAAPAPAPRTACSTSQPVQAWSLVHSSAAMAAR